MWTVTTDMLSDDFCLPPFPVEPYGVSAAQSWGCPLDQIKARVAVHLPDCGLCREYELFLNRYDLRPGEAL
eukprot:8147788-Alexandrium_andersonii.AAC.1